ncbi:MAG: glutamate racemase [Burkholderiaceae bacterium]
MEQAHRVRRVQGHSRGGRPITLGVFDSGVGGLSVLRDLQALMPNLPLVYVSDNAFAPYGEREVKTIQERTHKVTEYLRQDCDIKALVIACNTATAHAIDALRASHPDLPIIGVEPALKPAAALSASGHVGVMATRRTLGSDRYHRLQRQVETQSTRPLHFWSQPCDGLADAIENNRLDDVQRLCDRYVSELFSVGPQMSGIDTVVLGCTHYPFAMDALQKAAAKRPVRFLDTGIPVAKRTRDVLGPLLEGIDPGYRSPQPTLLTTGDEVGMGLAAQRWIHPSLSAQKVRI